MNDESRKTVLVALAANTGIAIAKLAAGVVTGSAAMLAEAAHSIADTANQLFLLASLRFSERKPDAEHPFGYGKERFLWSFMAAIFIFVSGAVFSVYEGVSRLLEHSGETSYTAAYVVLALGIVLEGASLIRAINQTKRDAASTEREVKRYVRTSRDPTTKTVLFEDSARGGRPAASRSSASGSRSSPASTPSTRPPRSRSACCWRSSPTRCGATRAAC